MYCHVTSNKVTAPTWTHRGVLNLPVRLALLLHADFNTIFLNVAFPELAGLKKSTKLFLYGGVKEKTTTMIPTVDCFTSTSYVLFILTLRWVCHMVCSGLCVLVMLLAVFKAFLWIFLCLCSAGWYFVLYLADLHCYINCDVVSCVWHCALRCF